MFVFRTSFIFVVGTIFWLHSNDFCCCCFDWIKTNRTRFFVVVDVEKSHQTEQLFNSDEIKTQIISPTKSINKFNCDHIDIKRIPKKKIECLNRRDQTNGKFQSDRFERISA